MYCIESNLICSSVVTFHTWKSCSNDYLKCETHPRQVPQLSCILKPLCSKILYFPQSTLNLSIFEILPFPVWRQFHLIANVMEFFREFSTVKSPDEKISAQSKKRNYKGNRYNSPVILSARNACKLGWSRVISISQIAWIIASTCQDH